MTGTRITPATNAVSVQGQVIERVPDQDGTFISPSMAHDAHIVWITQPPPGVRLGDWSSVDVIRERTEA